MNKFCWLRPQMILHTLDFQSQTDMLARDDFEAAISVLKQLGERYMLIFNGGPDAGSSVAHKHLQVFQRPEWKTAIDRVVEGEQLTLPFTYRLYRLSESCRADQLYGEYQAMCNDLNITNGRAHNLLLVREWMIIIPRSCANIKGDIEGALV